MIIIFSLAHNSFNRSGYSDSTYYFIIEIAAFITTFIFSNIH
jgi:hypothetical protein